MLKDRFNLTPLIEVTDRLLEKSQVSQKYKYKPQSEAINNLEDILIKHKTSLMLDDSNELEDEIMKRSIKVSSPAKETFQGKNR